MLYIFLLYPGHFVLILIAIFLIVLFLAYEIQINKSRFSEETVLKMDIKIELVLFFVVMLTWFYLFPICPDTDLNFKNIFDFEIVFPQT
jgi:hypothetical protein